MGVRQRRDEETHALLVHFPLTQWKQIEERKRTKLHDGVAISATQMLLAAFEHYVKSGELDKWIRVQLAETGRMTARSQITGHGKVIKATTKAQKPQGRRK